MAAGINERLHQNHEYWMWKYDFQGPQYYGQSEVSNNHARQNFLANVLLESFDQSDCDCVQAAVQAAIDAEGVHNE